MLFEIALAQRNLARDQELKERGVVSEQVLERSKAELERLQIAKRDARRSLGYTTVRSPISGIVTVRHIKYGDLVAPNQPLFQITDFNSLIAEVFVPEKDIARVRLGASARLQALGAKDVETLPEGVVQRIAPIVDPRSGTVKVTLDLPDTRGLRPGMFVDVHIVVASEDNALLIPRRALIYENDQPYVFRVNSENRAKRVRVHIAIEDNDFVKPRDGFETGQQVVIAGQVGLKDGAHVESIDKTNKPPQEAETKPTQEAEAKPTQEAETKPTTASSPSGEATTPTAAATSEP